MAKKRSKKHVARSAPSGHRAKSAHSNTAATKRTVPALLNVATAVAVLGVLLTAYLTAIRWFGETPAYCDAGSGCDVVQASRWSTLFGLPLSLWGMLLYLLLVALLWNQRRRPAAWPRALAVAAFGAGMSIYLTAVSVLEIEATCAYCLASLALLSTLFVLLLLLRPANLPRFDWGKWGIGTGAGVALILVALHLHYSGMFDPAAGPEKPELKALAEHLGDTDAKFYGAYWCPHCQDQKALFEASADRLPYVECTPGGRGGPVAVECLSKNISTYPTWIIGGTRYEGIQTPERLTTLSGFANQPINGEP